MSKSLKNKEVYIARDREGDVLYVGYGNFGRHKHCNSGTSHVFGLNEMFFLKGRDSILVEVVKQGITKQQAEKLEKELIIGLQPKFNKSMLNVDHQRKVMISGINFRRKIDYDMKVFYGNRYKSCITATTKLLSFIDYFKFGNLKEGVFIKPKFLQNAPKDVSGLINAVISDHNFRSYSKESFLLFFSVVKTDIGIYHIKIKDDVLEEITQLEYIDYINGK